MPDISKITLPGGNTYDIKDTVARESVTTVTNQVNQIISAGVSYQVVTSLPTPSEANKGIIYLVADSTSESGSYVEYICVNNGTSWVNEKIGTTSADLSEYAKTASLGSLASKNSVTLSKSTANVLGTGTAFQNSTSSVTFGTHTTASVIGASSTFTFTQPTITVTPSTTHVVASSSVPSVTTGSGSFLTSASVNGTTTALTGLGTLTYKKLSTASITGVSGSVTASKITAGDVVASKATAGTAVDVAKAGDAVTIPNVTGNSTITATKISSYGTAASWTATVANEVLTFGWTPNTIASGTNVTATKVTLGTAISVVPAVSNGTITPYTFADVTASKISANTDVTVPVAASAKTVATGFTTGGTASNGVVATIPATTATVVTSITTAEGDALTSAAIEAAPTITLATATTGGVVVATGISSAAATGGKVAWNSKDAKNAITALGAATAAAQTISVKTADNKTALLSGTDITVS